MTLRFNEHLLSRDEVFTKIRSYAFIWKYDLLLLSQGKIFEKIKQFFDVTWRFDPPLSQAETFAKIRQFCWRDMKIWTVRIITGWNFLKNMLDSTKSVENSHCLYYHGVKFPKNNTVLLMWLENLACLIIPSWNFCKKEGSFDDVTLKFKPPILPRGKVSKKIRPFLYIQLKTWPALLSRAEAFAKNKAVLMMSLEKLNWLYYEEVKFFQKYPKFNEVIWKYEFPLLSRGKIFAKSKAVLLMWLENLTCSYYHKRKLSQK